MSRTLLQSIYLCHGLCLGSWQEVKEGMKTMLVESNREGIMVPKITKSNRKSSVYKHPFPECACLQEAQNLTLNLPNVDFVLDQQLNSII